MVMVTEGSVREMSFAGTSVSCISGTIPTKTYTLHHVLGGYIDGREAVFSEDTFVLHDFYSKRSWNSMVCC